MTPDDFASFYESVHGYAPFPWQRRLLEEVVAQGWPNTIALPTSSGKTSAIDIAVFHLALEAGKVRRERRAALRVFFIIDRRVVVDEAAEHALELGKALLRASDGIVKQAADELRRFGGSSPLAVSTLRGGMYRDNTWADEPNQPLVCLSTVDQTGSRLLFRGYQLGPSSRPVHAALAGNDSLLIVDEAHLSTPFLETLSIIKRKYATWADAPPARPFEFVRMSATSASDEEPFLLQDRDLTHPVLGPRLSASKPAELRDPKKAFEEEVAAAARQFLESAEVSVVGVVVNTVGSARMIFNQLRTVRGAEAVLLTGRNRPYSSQKLWQKWKPRIEANPDRPNGERVFVVATQTVEVGANLDFDALVTESAPLDALRQRFGRLNRLARRDISNAVIVLRPKGDPVYGDPTAKTWAFLKENVPIDFGVRAMDRLLKGRVLDEWNTKKSRAPLMFPAHLEFWVQTNPQPSSDPDVAPFLHGPATREAADVQVIWREDLLGGQEEKWNDLVELAPPVSNEAVSLPIATVRRWLRSQKQDLADVEGITIKDGKEESREPMRAALIWRGISKKYSIDPRDIQPGDTIIVPCSYKGCDEYGWNPDHAETEDIGDQANNEQAERGLRQPRIRLRLARKRVPDTAAFDEALKRLRGDEEDGPDRDALEELLAMLQAPYKGTPKVDSTLEVVTWPKQKAYPPVLIDASSDETDEDDSASLKGFERNITLRDHTAGVEDRARRYATGCGLDAGLVEALCLAARLHDLGKCDERFQAWLRGATTAGREPLAKSNKDPSLGDFTRLRDLAGYPAGARHEAASVMVACASGLAAETHRDLVLYLIGTHHGYGRPLFPVWDEDPEFSVFARVNGIDVRTSTGLELARIDSGWIDRFWRLNRKYGYWGLAYLEAVLRRADCMQSRQEEKRG